MAVAPNVSAGAGFATGTTRAFSIAGVLAGDSIFICVWCNAATAPVSVVDGQGAYSLVGVYEYDSNSGYGSALYVLDSATAGTHAGTITFGSSIANAYGYASISGAQPGNDGAGGAAYSASTNPVTCTITNSASGDFVLSFAVNWAGTAVTAQSGTPIALTGIGTGFVCQWQTQSGSGAITPSFTFGTPQSASMNAVGLIAASSSATGAAAISEPADTVVASGAAGTPGAGTAAVAEAADSVAAAGSGAGGGSFGASYDGTVRVSSGGKLVNGAGASLLLRGLNTPADSQITETGDWTNPGGSYSGLSGYPLAFLENENCNAIRITINVGAWLGLTYGILTGSSPNTAAWSGSTQGADPDNTYKQYITNIVNEARRRGQYIFINAHWSAPTFTLGGVTNYLGAVGQPPFMDYDTTYPYWTAGAGAGPGGSTGIVAYALANWVNPATGTINDIIWELFNEPYLDDSGKSISCNTQNLGAGSSLTYLQAMLNGGYANGWSNQRIGTVGSIGMPTALCGASSQPGSGSSTSTFYYWWRVAGYQQCLTGIRALGATNVVFVNGGSYASKQGDIPSIYPTDTLSPPQIGTGWHPYELSSGAGFPTSETPNAAANQNGTSGIGHPIPVTCTEGGNNAGTEFTTAYYNGWTSMAGTYNIGIVAWQWNSNDGAAQDANWYMNQYGSGVSWTGSISGTTMTVTSGSGIAVGMVLTGGATADRSYIVAQLTGTPGGAGTYQVSVSQSVGSTTITGTPYVPSTAGGGGAGTFFAWTSSLVSSASGAAAITEGSDTVSAVGTYPGGSAAIQEASDVAVGVGSSGTAGAGAPTEAHDTVSASGSSSTTGSGAPTEGQDTASGIGQAGFGGLAGITEGQDIAAGVGGGTGTGAAAITEPHDIAAGAGAGSVSGIASISESVDIAHAIGVGTGTGSAAIQEPSDQVAGIGTVSTIGAAAIHEGSDAASGTGALSPTGIAHIQEGHDTAAGTGSGATAGAAAVHEAPDVVAAAGVTIGSGSAAIIESADVSTGQGTESMGDARTWHVAHRRKVWQIKEQ